MITNRNAVIYARFSSDNQREESIDAQVRAISEYATKNSYNIIKVYADKAKSAKSDNRPEFQNMVNDSKLGLFSFVIVHKLDRFSRDRYDSANYKRKLKQNGVRVLSVLENLDDTPESIILESMLEGMAEYYSANLAREVQKGQKETALQCKHLGGAPPLGYCLNEDNTYRIDEEEARIVQLIFSQYIKGFTYSQILDKLNKFGYKTRRKTEFSKSGLNKILSNEKYCGVYLFNQFPNKNNMGKRNSTIRKSEDEIIRIKGGMPQIISTEDFEKVQMQMQHNKQSRGAKKATANYLLSGIIRCGECGYSMHGNKRPAKNGHEYISYRCGGKKSKHLCTNGEIRKELIEEFVLSELESMLLNDEVTPRIVKEINDKMIQKDKKETHMKQSLEEQLSKVNKDINNIIEAIMLGIHNQTLKEKMDELERIKANLEMELAQFKQEPEEENENKPITEEEVRSMLAEMKEYVITRNLPQCKQLIQKFVKEVIVYKDHVEVIFNMVFYLGKNKNFYSCSTSKKRSRL